MNKHNLTADNYYQDTDYMSVSTVKGYLQCSAYQEAKRKGLWVDLDYNINFAIGHMFESLLQGEFESRYSQTPEFEFCMLTKAGKPNADYKKVIEMYNRVKTDKIFMKYCTGEYEVILVGKIHGVNFKGKIDILNLENGFFSDIKTTRSLGKFWSDKYKSKVNFYTEYDYWMQLAVYQELIKQNFYKLMWPFLPVCSKTKPYNYDVLRVEKYTDGTYHEILAEKLEELQFTLQDIDAIKNGEKEAERCEQCAYCVSTFELKETSLMEQDYFE